MEQIMPNLVRAIAKVQNSLRFGLLCEAIIRIAPKKETAMANTGLVDTMVSILCNLYKNLFIYNVDGFVKSRKTSFPVIPAKAEIQLYQMLAACLDPGFRRGDDFLRNHQCYHPNWILSDK